MCVFGVCVFGECQSDWDSLWGTAVVSCCSVEVAYKVLVLQIVYCRNLHTELSYELQMDLRTTQTQIQMYIHTYTHLNTPRHTCCSSTSPILWTMSLSLLLRCVEECCLLSISFRKLLCRLMRSSKQGKIWPITSCSSCTSSNKPRLKTSIITVSVWTWWNSVCRSSETKTQINQLLRRVDTNQSDCSNHLTEIL